MSSFHDDQDHVTQATEQRRPPVRTAEREMSLTRALASKDTIPTDEDPYADVPCTD